MLFGLGFEAAQVGLLVAAVGPKGAPWSYTRLIYVGHGWWIVRRVAGPLHVRGQRRRRRGPLLFGAEAASAASLAIGSIVGLGLVARSSPAARGPLVALSEACRCATAVGLAVIGMFVAALVPSMAAPALRRGRQQQPAVLRQDAAAALRGLPDRDSVSRVCAFAGFRLHGDWQG